MPWREEICFAKIENRIDNKAPNPNEKIKEERTTHLFLAELSASFLVHFFVCLLQT